MKTRTPEQYRKLYLYALKRLMNIQSDSKYILVWSQIIREAKDGCVGV